MVLPILKIINSQFFVVFVIENANSIYDFYYSIIKILLFQQVKKLIMSLSWIIDIR